MLFEYPRWYVHRRYFRLLFYTIAFNSLTLLFYSLPSIFGEIEISVDVFLYMSALAVILFILAELCPFNKGANVIISDEGICIEGKVVFWEQITKHEHSTDTDENILLFIPFFYRNLVFCYKIETKDESQYVIHKALINYSSLIKEVEQRLGISSESKEIKAMKK